MITEDQLRRIMPGANAAKVTQYLPHLQAAMDEFEINTPARVAAFLAQLAHESGQFRFMEEIWGPTQAQRRYEPVTSLSRTLGNTQAGDGFRYKGRGPIQLTGRANYQRFGDLLGVDLVNNPAQAATPEIAFRIAALFWKSRGLNPLADAQNFREITRRINGGFNGLADRLNFFARAKAVLGVGAGAGAGRAGASMPGRAGAAPGRAGAGARDEDTGLSRGILPGDPQFGRMVSEGGAKKAGASAKKAGAKKAGAKKSGAKKAGAKKVAGKKSGAKKAAAGKGGAKKAGSKKGGAGKGAAKKGGARKAGASAKKAGAKKRR